MTSSVTGASALVCINSVEIHPVVVRGQRVLIFTQIDKVHGRPEGTARRNFTENKSRLIEGQDFFVITRKSSMDEIRALGNIPPKGITVVTESGYLLLVKSFTDDLAWQIQRELVNAYFRVNPERVVGERYDTLIPSEQQTLSEIVHAKVAHLAPDLQGKGLAEIWSRLHHKFRIAKYSQLPRTRIAEAILYVTQMELRGVPGPAPEPTITTITPAQQRQLADAVQQAMCGWVFTKQHVNHVYNALRVDFHLERIADLPASDFEHALSRVDQIRAMNGEFLRWIGDVRETYLRDYLMGGAPWTPNLKREWKKQMRTALPPRPNWLEIQQQLALKGGATPVAI